MPFFFCIFGFVCSRSCSQYDIITDIVEVNKKNHIGRRPTQIRVNNDTFGTLLPNPQNACEEICEYFQASPFGTLFWKGYPRGRCPLRIPCTTYPRCSHSPQGTCFPRYSSPFCVDPATSPSAVRSAIEPSPLYAPFPLSQISCPSPLSTRHKPSRFSLSRPYSDSTSP